MMQRSLPGADKHYSTPCSASKKAQRCSTKAVKINPNFAAGWTFRASMRIAWANLSQQLVIWSVR
jgi:hypothetical protein